MASSQDVLVTCKKCTRKVAVRDMKYDFNGKDLICERCYEIRAATVKKPKYAGNYADPRDFKVEFTDPIEAKKEVKYACIRCKFKFKRKIENGVPVNCPYCGKPSIVKQHEGSAESLIEESLSERYEG